MDYAAMLKKARKELPEIVFQKERFEIPKIQGHIEGNKTVLSNFGQIASTFQRPPANMLKFVLREVATPGAIRGQSVVMGSKVPASRINEKIRKYAEEYVLCRECGKPDTKLVEEKGITRLKCMACAASHVVKA